MKDHNNMNSTPIFMNSDSASEELKQKIRTATLKLLYHNGYNAITIKNISDNLNIEPGDISRMYTSPVEILTDIIQWAIQFGDSLSIELNAIADPHTKIEKYIILHFAFLDSHPEMATLLLADESISGSRRLHNKLLQLRSHRKSLLKSILTLGKTDSLWVSDDTEQMTLLILGYMRMTIASWKHSGTKESLYVYGKIAARFILEVLASKTKNNKEAADEVIQK